MDPSALVIAGVGLVLALVAVPLWMEKIPPNYLYGFRTPRTVSDARVWYPANRILGKDMVLAGVVMLLCAAGLGTVMPAGSLPSLPLIILSALAPILAILHGFYAASALVAELDGIAPPAATQTPAAAPSAEPAAKPTTARPPRQPEGPPR